MSRARITMSLEETWEPVRMEYCTRQRSTRQLLPFLFSLTPLYIPNCDKY